MMEYFTYKKVKKHQEEKKRHSETKVQTPTPVLSDEDVHFLERIVSAEGTPPALPERPSYLNPEAGDSTENESQMVVHDDKEEESNSHHKGKGKVDEKLSDKEKKAAKKAANRFSFITSRFGKKKDGLSPNNNVSSKEAAKEEDDINKILDDLNLAAVNNRAFSISKESQALVQKFTVILKDLVNGAPTAYDDLVNLIEDSQGTLAKSYDHLPAFLQKLITTLPNKLTSSLAPELLMVATEAQAMHGGDSSKSSGGLKGMAKSLLVPGNLQELVTKPGAVVGMLKYIMNVLKLRWPAFMGTNVLLSLGLFILLFVFWYCHKRGRDTRLERERIEAGGAPVESNGRVTELDDDPMLAPPRSRTSRERHEERDRPSHEREREREHRHRDVRESPPRERRSHHSRRERSSDERRNDDDDRYDKHDRRR